MKPIRTLASFAIAAALMLPAAAAQAVTFDFTTEASQGDPNGLTTLSGNAFSPAVFTNKDGNKIEILTFSPQGSVGGYSLDTFGSGPRIQNTQVYGQRAMFLSSPTDIPEVRYSFESTVKLISATFVLYNRSENLEIDIKRIGETSSDRKKYFPSTDAYDKYLASTGPAPAMPPEFTVLFDSTDPLTNEITMRSLGQSGAALQKLVVSYVPVPAGGLLLLSGLGVAGILGRRRLRA